MSELHVRTILEGRGPAAAIVLTDGQVASLDAGKTFPVVVSLGDRSIRLGLARMGGDNRLRLARMGGDNLIGLSKPLVRRRTWKLARRSR